MPIPVPLRDVIEAMDLMADEWRAYINRKTGEIVDFGDEEAMYAEEIEPDAPDWMAERLPKIREVLSSEDYVELPGQFDFHEYAVMEQFCLSVNDPDVRERLLSSIRGRGAFRRFKEAIIDLGVREQWFSYRDGALRDLAVDFLDAESIPYLDPDAPKEPAVDTELPQSQERPKCVYLVMAMRTPQFDPSVIDLHSAFLDRLREEGVLEKAGPFTDRSGGAYLLKADSLEEAEAIAFRDPVHTTKSSIVTVYEWKAK